MPQDRKIDFKPQNVETAAPPILEKILEQYKYFRGIVWQKNIFLTNFSTNGELVSLYGFDDDQSRILRPQRTAEGFIFDFLEESTYAVAGDYSEYSLRCTPTYSPSTGRIIKTHWSILNGDLEGAKKSNKILYASSAEVISQYLAEEKQTKPNRRRNHDR